MSEKAGHTKGQWLKTEEGKGIYVLGPAGTNAFWALFQTAGRDRISEDELRANACLAAAAPDLLKALKDVVSFVDCLEYPLIGLSSLAETARAAIAKATGNA